MCSYRNLHIRQSAKTAALAFCVFAAAACGSVAESPMCDPGYELDGTACVDIDECAGPNPCGGGVCINEDGGYTCDCDPGYEYDGTTCAAGSVGVAGDGTPESPRAWADGTYAPSCQAYRSPQEPYAYQGSVGDGIYTIQPGDTAVDVYCDMTTDGGGWTAIDPAAAVALGGTATPVVSEGETYCEVNADGLLEAYDVGDSILVCQYDIDLRFSFNTIRVSQADGDKLRFMPIVGDNGSTDVSDFLNATWEQAWQQAPGSSNGDVLIGTAAHPTAALGLGRALGVESGNYREFFDLQPAEWLADETANSTRDTVLRLQISESGGQSEGFRWERGRIYVRDDVDLANIDPGAPNSAANPRAWEDGTLAASCYEYRYPPEGHVSASVDGYYSIDENDDGIAEVVYCNQTDNGGGWTRAFVWDREADPDLYTLSSFQNLLVDEIAEAGDSEVSPMGDLTELADRIRWSDYDSTYDALSYRHDVAIPNGGELLLDVHYAGTSMEASGVWFYAMADGSPQDIVCWSDAEGSSGYSAAEQALIPYACDADTIVQDVTWNGLEERDMGAEITSFHVRSLHADNNLGDNSNLYRLALYVR